MGPMTRKVPTNKDLLAPTVPVNKGLIGWNNSTSYS